MARLFWLCERLDAARIFHEDKKIRDDVLSIHAAVPDERWEIEIDREGDVTIERFKATGDAVSLDQFDTLLNRQTA